MLTNYQMCIFCKNVILFVIYLQCYFKFILFINADRVLINLTRDIALNL